MRRQRLLTAALGLVFCVAPCAEQANSQEPTTSSTPSMDGEAAPYNPIGRRDPFRPFILDLRRREPENVALNPLQQYDLGQLTVAGTLWQTDPPRAMIEDSAGMGFIVTIGTPIGRNGGVVAAIEPRRVVVEEKIVDFYGNEQVNRVVMETPSDEGTSQPGREKR